jgi:hypothetical protein
LQPRELGHAVKTEEVVPVDSADAGSEVPLKPKKIRSRRARSSAAGSEDEPPVDLITPSLLKAETKMSSKGEGGEDKPVSGLDSIPIRVMTKSKPANDFNTTDVTSSSTIPEKRVVKQKLVPSKTLLKKKV